MPVAKQPISSGFPSDIDRTRLGSRSKRTSSAIHRRGLSWWPSVRRQCSTPAPRRGGSFARKTILTFKSMPRCEEARRHCYFVYAQKSASVFGLRAPTGQLKGYPLTWQILTDIPRVKLNSTVCRTQQNDPIGFKTFLTVTFWISAPVDTSPRSWGSFANMRRGHWRRPGARNNPWVIVLC